MDIVRIRNQTAGSTAHPRRTHRSKFNPGLNPAAYRDQSRWRLLTRVNFHPQLYNKAIGVAISLRALSSRWILANPPSLFPLLRLCPCF